MAPVTDLYDAVVARVDTLTDRATSRIRSEIPGYTDIPATEHRQDIRALYSMVLNGLKTRRPPPPHTVQTVRDVGRRRADRGLGLSGLVEGYLIGYSELWDELMAEASAHEPDLTAALAREAAFVVSWFHRLTATVADAHATEMHSRAVHQLTLRRRFLEHLMTFRDPAEAATLARSLGLDPDGAFAVICAAPFEELSVDRLDAALRDKGVIAIAVQTPGRAIVISQHTDDQVATALRSFDDTTRLGIGLRREGLAGAAESLVDATQALDLAVFAGRDIRFSDDWLQIVLHAARPRLSSVLAPGAAVAARHHSLAETVRAYVECGYSVSACARRLHVHANTATYRLDRWKVLTGWDVRDLAALTASMLSVNDADWLRRDDHAAQLTATTNHDAAGDRAAT